VKLMPAAEAQPPEPRGLRLVRPDTYPSWEEVYRDNAERIYRLMFGRVGNRPDAEDLTAEVFLAAMPRLRPDASVGEVRAYLRATARTALAEHWRRTLGRQLTTIDPDDLADEPPEEKPDKSGQVRRLLAGLPERYRKILELRFLQAASIREAAGHLGVTVGNAKVLQYRALRAAAKFIDAEGR
jgi:RNA polymerase sigma-70 factor (ECF subfamily)